MFGRKRRNMSSTESMVFDAPPPVNVGNPTGPAVILTIFACFIAALPILWWAGVFILETAEVRQPERTLALALVYGCGGSLVLIGVLLLATLASRLLLTDILDYKVEIQSKKIILAERLAEQARYQQLTAGHPLPTGRASGEDQRFAKIVQAVMFTAYDSYAKNGPFVGLSRPWSRRNVLAVQLSDGTTPSDTMAGQVRSWLESRDIVKGNQINTDRFPDLGSVQELLYQEFDRPIVVNQSPTLSGSSSGYKFIE